VVVIFKCKNNTTNAKYRPIFKTCMILLFLLELDCTLLQRACCCACWHGNRHGTVVERRRTSFDDVTGFCALRCNESDALDDVTVSGLHRRRCIRRRKLVEAGRHVVSDCINCRSPLSAALKMTTIIPAAGTFQLTNYLSGIPVTVLFAMEGLRITWISKGSLSFTFMQRGSIL